MNSTERSTRVFAGIAAFLVVFSAPRLLLEMFDDSFPTVLLIIQLGLEMQARHLQAQLDDLAKQTGVLP